jgi:hypothetical protein
MHLKPKAGCQISILIFEEILWRGVSINIPYKYIKDGKVLAHFDPLPQFFLKYQN